MNSHRITVFDYTLAVAGAVELCHHAGVCGNIYSNFRPPPSSCSNPLPPGSHYNALSIERQSTMFYYELLLSGCDC